jgi:biopolymer transport protein ExbD
MKIPRTSSHPLVEAQMISLADIAFLVIFFFLTTSNFMKDKVPLSLPQADGNTPTQANIFVVVGPDGNAFLNGEPMANGDTLESHLKTILSGKTDAKDCEVRLRCDKTLTYKQYSPIYTAISNAGGVISIIHEPKSR